MEKPPKISESENIKKIFNLPGKQQVEWKFDPRTGEILSLTKKDADGNTVEFYDLEREEMAQAYENYEKTATQPTKPRRKTPAQQSPEQDATKKETPKNWRPYATYENPKTDTTTHFFCNKINNHIREIVTSGRSKKILQYVERSAEGDIINFENFEAISPSDLQTRLDQAKKDYTYFEDLEKLGWENPTEQ
ncbi:MAG: hypothetical protein AAB378_00400 [Patescibacteria group bacterium]|mgnify:CR=1 FL=1